jgi:hypothetical protein
MSARSGLSGSKSRHRLFEYAASRATDGGFQRRSALDAGRLSGSEARSPLCWWSGKALRDLGLEIPRKGSQVSARSIRPTNTESTMLRRSSLQSNLSLPARQVRTGHRLLAGPEQPPAEAEDDSQVVVRRRKANLVRIPEVTDFVSHDGLTSTIVFNGLLRRYDHARQTTQRVSVR